jgi:hypothetical protein
MYIPYTLGYRVVNKRTYHFGELLVFPSEKSSTYVSVRLRFFLSPTRRISSKMVRSQLCLFWLLHLPQLDELSSFWFPDQRISSKRTRCRTFGFG